MTTEHLDLRTILTDAQTFLNEVSPHYWRREERLVFRLCKTIEKLLDDGPSPIAAWISTRGVTLQYSGQDETKMRNLGWEPLFRRPAPKPKRERYRARFVPQAWVNNNAITVDDEGPTDWDCTQYLTGHFPGYFDTMWAARLAHNVEALDNDDVLKDDPAAPEWVRNWVGPFDIWMRKVTV